MADMVEKNLLAERKLTVAFIGGQAAEPIHLLRFVRCDWTA